MTQIDTETVYDEIERLHDESDGEGAPWEAIVDSFDDEQAVENAVNTLLDDDRVYEPVLGRIKPT